MIRRTRTHLIDAVDAKSMFEELLDRVAKGEVIVITRHGAPVAKLEPHEEPIDVAVVDRAIREVEKLRKGIKLRGITVRELIEEGRRM